MKQRSRRLARRLALRSRRRQEQLREMEEEQQEAEQARQKELRIQKQITQLDTAIQDLEEMIHSDLSYNVSVNYYEKPYLYTAAASQLSGSGGIKKHKRSFDIIKEQHLNLLLPDEQRKVYNSFTLAKHSGDDEEFGVVPRYRGRRDKKLTDIVPFGIAETSDKFIAILNIVKQQNARIEEFERMFALMRKRIIELERIVEDEATNDQLTGVSDSDVGLIVNTQ